MEQACSTAGFVPEVEHLPSAAAFFETVSRHPTVRVCWPSPHVVEQAPHVASSVHSYATQAWRLHGFVLDGSTFVALVQSESSTAVTVVPCVDWHALPMRNWVPPPQVTEHVPKVAAGVVIQAYVVHGALEQDSVVAGLLPSERHV